jgi:hypothetical protein
MAKLKNRDGIHDISSLKKGHRHTHTHKRRASYQAIIFTNKQENVIYTQEFLIITNILSYACEGHEGI